MKKYGKRLNLLGALAGVVGGYVYWREVGCLSGHCPIQSNWQTMSVWGGIMGFLLTDLGLQLKQTSYKRYGNANKTTLQ